MAVDLYANDGNYIGNTNNELDPNSIHNELGRYGNPLSPDSIHNDLGKYGSDLSNTSPNNSLAKPGRAVNPNSNTYREFGGYSNSGY